jgi:hypothetical protein
MSYSIATVRDWPKLWHQYGNRLILAGATSEPLLYEPGTNWNSAHTN